MFCIFDTLANVHIEEGNDEVSGVRVFNTYSEAVDYKDNLTADGYSDLEIRPFHVYEDAGPVKEEVIIMNICEVPHLILKPNVIYKFVVAENCESCRLAAEEAG
jgi:hypothetical protein